MDSSQAKEKIAPRSAREKASADPFASDIFAAPVTKENVESDIAPRAEIENKNNWVLRVPKVPRPAIDWNKLWRNLPPDFSDELPRLLAEALARHLNLANRNLIEFLFFVKRETGGIPEENGNAWWARVGIENSKAEFAVEIDDGFAVWLVDAMLGEKVSDSVQVRDLTPSEIAVLEFLAVNLTHEANAIVNAPLFKLHFLSREVPAIQKSDVGTDSGVVNASSIIVSTWQTVHGFGQSIIKLYITPEALMALQANENKLLTAAPRQFAIWNSLQTRVKDVRARISLGEAQITFAEVAELEKGDVILMENYDFSISSSGFYGSSKIFLGDGEQVEINGSFESSEEESPDAFEEIIAGVDNEFLVHRIKSNHALRFFIESVEELENPQLLEKSMPEENINFTERETEESFDESSEGNGVSLENLAVTLRVELEARRLSLAEVGDLRVNQIIELGARATDPVNLLIDNKVVARGELVEVDEQLGVRIVQILR